MRYLILAALILLPANVFAQDTQALAIMQEAGAKYRTIGSFCADFEQTLEVPLLGDTHYSRGNLCQAQPDLFAMRYSDPNGDVVVADGDWFWVYYPSVDSVQVIQFSMQVRPGGLDFHREFLEEPAQKYSLEYLGEELVNGKRAHLISAVPLETAGFTEARLWLDVEESVILQVRIGMENSSVRTLTLDNVRLNPPADPERFAFSPPQGAQVIRRN